jgi:hypothetical protein
MKAIDGESIGLFLELIAVIATWRGDWIRAWLAMVVYAYRCKLILLTKPGPNN